MLEDNSATVTLSMGAAKSGKSGHFRRMVAYLEGLTNRGILWLDYTPSKENPSDILTKSVTPVEQFCRMRDVINGSNPVLFVSQKVKDILQTRSLVSHSFGSLRLVLPGSYGPIHQISGDMNFFNVLFSDG